MPPAQSFTLSIWVLPFHVYWQDKIKSSICVPVLALANITVFCHFETGKILDWWLYDVYFFFWIEPVIWSLFWLIFFDFWWLILAHTESFCELFITLSEWCRHCESLALCLCLWALVVLSGKQRQADWGAEESVRGVLISSDAVTPVLFSSFLSGPTHRPAVRHKIEFVIEITLWCESQDIEVWPAGRSRNWLWLCPVWRCLITARWAQP